MRLLRALEIELDAEGLDVRFTIVGDGSERDWLQRHMRRAEFTGVLLGSALADAYAQMDIFAFPSETDTVGNVVLEAMASGVPPGVMATGGQRFIVDAGQTAIVARDKREFIEGVRTLVKNRERRSPCCRHSSHRPTTIAHDRPSTLDPRPSPIDQRVIIPRCGFS